jgi:hypothetical protein
MTTFLMRAAVLAIGKPPATVGLDVQLGHVTLACTRPVSVEGKPAGVMFIAYVPLSDPLTAAAGKAVLPVEERREAEFALETTARVMALDCQCSHRLLSPMPFIGFWSDEDGGVDTLEGLVVDQPVVQSFQGAAGGLGLLTPDVVDALSDRLDGVARWPRR